MLLRRITQHVKEQNWFAVVLDFLIVVLGVYIGLQVSNWNEARGARILEQQYIALLYRDLKAIESTLSTQQDHESSMKGAANTALEKINEQSLNPDPLAVGQALMNVFGRRTLTLESPAFTELKSAGRLAVVRDAVLRNRLISYFENLKTTERVVEKNNEFFVEPFGAFIRDSGIGFVPMPESHCANDKSTLCSINAVLSSFIGDQKTHSVEQVLAAPSNDLIWAKLRSQVAYRAIAAIANSQNVQDSLDETRDVYTLLMAAQ